MILREHACRAGLSPEQPHSRNDRVLPSPVLSHPWEHVSVTYISSPSLKLSLLTPAQPPPVCPYLSWAHSAFPLDPSVHSAGSGQGGLSSGPELLLLPASTPHLSVQPHLQGPTHRVTGEDQVQELDLSVEPV